VSSIAHRGLIHLGMDVSKDAITLAVLPPDSDVAEVDKIFHDEESVRRLVKRLGRPSGLYACYEAGPTGYDLQRLLSSKGVRCDVDCTVGHSNGSWRSRENRPPRCSATGGTTSFRRAHAGRHPLSQRGGGARSVPYAR
jgi:hypothetical protein